jgi:hypothetical protein
VKSYILGFVVVRASVSWYNNNNKVWLVKSYILGFVVVRASVSWFLERQDVVKVCVEDAMVMVRPVSHEKAYVCMPT